MKTVIYQLFVRHFGNLVTLRGNNETLEFNGCGKFEDITEKALLEIQKLGFTHVWLTGVLEHASGTAYKGRPADDPKILKGIAGSPYAVRDYFDVCPDLAVNTTKRLEEFRDLVARCHHIGLKVIIDFIPNHVSRSYDSDVKPAFSFGKRDKTDVFFNAANNYFYLKDSKKLILPTGEYPAEKVPRVTGNNVCEHEVSRNDWYETVKLNYGYNFVNGDKAFKDSDQIPTTWNTMDMVLEHWQQLGVDGFRCDMAHMVPVEFWKWLVENARERSKDVEFIAEAYDGDPMKVTDGNVLDELIELGFNSVYDSESYDLVKKLYEENKWANDLDHLLFDEKRLHTMLRYVENHDEGRVASPKHWGGHGYRVGKAVSAYLFGVGRGAVMLYNGQEVGEPAKGAEGYSKDDGKTSIFDYTSVPELQKWVNNHAYDGGGLSEEQAELRTWYGRWMNLLQQPAFRDGGVYSLNPSNQSNVNYGRVGDETVSGHWLYSFLRYDNATDQAYLVVINFNPTKTLEGVEIVFSDAARVWLGDYPYAGLSVGDMPPCEVMTYCLKNRVDQA